MFGFLKNKLKEWVGSAKEKVSSKEPEQKEAEANIDASEAKASEPAIKKETAKKPGKKPKKEKKEKIIKKPEELATQEDITQTNKEKSNAEKIAKKLEQGKITAREAIKELEEEREKSEELFEEAHPTVEETIEEENKPQPEVEEKKSFLSKLFGKKQPEQAKPEVETIKPETDEKPITQETPKEKTFFEKVKSSFIYKITQEDFNSMFEDLEMLLLENNVAYEAVDSIKEILSKNLIGKEIKKDDLEKEIRHQLKETLNELLVEPDDPMDIIKMKSEKPFTILFFGINGTGKTTSIAKLTYLLKQKGFSVVLAAADTFRAASIEQISEHAKRLEVPLVKHDYGSDPAAVGFDAIKYAKAHGIDVVLIDTAGRMHTKGNLMSEMEKIVRVTNPDLKIFVAESIAGNDATEQAKSFHETVNIDGSILSKADIDEKGGTIISISSITKKPIFYLGTGQNYSDLKLFNKQEFIESLGLE